MPAVAPARSLVAATSAVQPAAPLMMAVKAKRAKVLKKKVVKKKDKFKAINDRNNLRNIANDTVTGAQNQKAELEGDPSADQTLNPYTRLKSDSAALWKTGAAEDVAGMVHRLRLPLLPLLPLRKFLLGRSRPTSGHRPQRVPPPAAAAAGRRRRRRRRRRRLELGRGLASTAGSRRRRR